MMSRRSIVNKDNTMYFLFKSNRSVIALVFLVFVGGLYYSYSFAYGQTLQTTTSPSINEIPVPVDPMKIYIANDGLLYVPSFAESTITIIDTQTNKTVDQINLENDEQAMTVLPVVENDRIYVPIFEAGKINVYSMQDHSLEDVIFLPESTKVFDTPTSDQVLEEGEEITVNTGVWSLDYNPENMLLYSVDYNTNVLYVVDLDTNIVIETLDVSRHPYSVKVDPNTDTVIVTSLAGNSISFVQINPGVDDDGENSEIDFAIIHQITNVVESPIGPWGLDIDSANGLAYVTNRGADTLTVLDINEQAIVEEILLQSRGQAVTVDSDSNKIYVGYYQQDDTVLKIDGDTRQVLSVFDPEDVAWDMEFDMQNDLLYMSLKDANKIISVTPNAFEEAANYNENGGADASIGEEVLSAFNLEDTECKNNEHISAIKKSTNESVCVKPDSAAKLIERGWALP